CWASPARSASASSLRFSPLLPWRASSWRVGCGGSGRKACRFDAEQPVVTHLVLIALGVLIAVLAVVSVLGILPSLRIVPDNTHFDFTQFRRISFPISAVLSIFAITLFFTHGLNFGIDFKGGTLLEVQAKSGAADIGSMRNTLSGLGLGDVQLQQFGGPDAVLIRVAEKAGGDQAQQAAVQKVRGAL